jgi:hypothetical protein
VYVFSFLNANNYNEGLERERNSGIIQEDGEVKKQLELFFLSSIGGVVVTTMYVLKSTNNALCHQTGGL